MVKKIGVVTSTRADYGLLKNLLIKIQKDRYLKLFLFVTGTHLSKKYGLTIDEIKKDNLIIFSKVKTLDKENNPYGVSKTMSNTIKNFGKVFQKTKIDLLIVLGDRYEILCISIVANMFNIPIAHIHGGEITFGSLDDRFRHCITKLSDFHFTSAKEHAQRVVQLGENPAYVNNVGAIGIDNIKKQKLLSKRRIQEKLKIDLYKPYFLVTFHPETTNLNSLEKDFNFLIKCINSLKDFNFIFTYSNADIGGKFINTEIDKLVLKNKEKFFVFPSLGSLNYLSLMKDATAVLGNSSSGIFEAPALKVPTIDIGLRQNGRPLSDSVFKINKSFSKFKKAINIIIATDFKKQLIKNPYGNGGSSKKIFDFIKKNKFKVDKTKSFYDLNLTTNKF